VHRFAAPRIVHRQHTWPPAAPCRRRIACYLVPGGPRAPRCGSRSPRTTCGGALEVRQGPPRRRRNAGPVDPPGGVREPSSQGLLAVGAALVRGDAGPSVPLGARRRLARGGDVSSATSSTMPTTSSSTGACLALIAARGAGTAGRDRAVRHVRRRCDRGRGASCTAASSGPRGASTPSSRADPAPVRSPSRVPRASPTPATSSSWPRGAPVEVAIGRRPALLPPCTAEAGRRHPGAARTRRASVRGPGSTPTAAPGVSREAVGPGGGPTTDALRGDRAGQWLAAYVHRPPRFEWMFWDAAWARGGMGSVRRVVTVA